MHNLLKVSLGVCIASLVSGAHSQSNRIVNCLTTKGKLKIEVIPEWAPIGAARFLELVQDDFYTNIALFRCVDGFLTQFGLSTDPQKKHWHYRNIPDDPHNGHPISRHILSYAGGGPNTRSTQIFFAFEDLDFLGSAPWEVPFGRIIDGAEVLTHLYKGYGDIPPFGKGPDQQLIQTKDGEFYLKENFPELDYILSCAVEEPVLPDGYLRGADVSLELNPDTDTVHTISASAVPVQLVPSDKVDSVDPTVAIERHLNYNNLNSNSNTEDRVELQTDEIQLLKEAGFPEIKPPPHVVRETAPTNDDTTEGDEIGDKTGAGGFRSSKNNEQVESEVEEKGINRGEGNTGHYFPTVLKSSEMTEADWRMLKVQAIFLFFLIAIILIIFSIWRNKRKYRTGKLI